jgi:hypothetical protein
MPSRLEKRKNIDSIQEFTNLLKAMSDIHRDLAS